MKTPLTLVIFGATGNLYSDKLAKALFLLFLEKKLPLDFQILGFARKDLTDTDFRNFTKDSILKRGSADGAQLDSFLEHVVYFKGNFLEKNDVRELKDFIVTFSHKNPERQVMLHIATASQAYEKIFENIIFAQLNRVTDGVKILIEKPFGRDEFEAERLYEILSPNFKPKDIFNIDHYLAKETARDMSEERWSDVDGEEIWNKDKIEKIKVIFHESNIVGSRGASYDAVGAFKDVGQNHMVELLALVTMERPALFDAENIRASRRNALSDLFIDSSKKVVRAQYEDYRREPGVSPDSETETFFRVFLRSKNPRFSDVVFELEGGKGLVDMHSPITTTTVAVEVYFKNGEKKEFRIQPVEKTVYESYTTVYNDALAGDQTNFPDIAEIIAEWKLTDELLKLWKDVTLLFYKKGIKAEDIQ